MNSLINKALEREPIWQDNFDGDLSEWIQETLQFDDLHRAGYNFLETDGSVGSDDWNKVSRRWAANYADHRDKVQYIKNELLHLGGYIKKKKNVYRKNFTDKNKKLNAYGDYDMGTAWLSQWSRKWLNDDVGHVTNTDQPVNLLKPGCYIQTRVNFEQVKTRGFRVSLWLMPAVYKGEIVASDAYDGNTENGAEIDIFEYENPEKTNREFGQRLFTKVVGGDAGDTKNGQQNLLKNYGIDLRKGWHTIGLLWDEDGSLSWDVDGIHIVRDGRSFLAESYLCWTREMCAGVKGSEDNPQEGDNLADGPYMPRDPGLSGQSVILDKALIPEDVALVDYIRVYPLKDVESEPEPIASDPVVEKDTDLDDLLVTPDITLSDTEVDTAEVVEALSSEIDRLICVNNALQVDLTKCQRDNERLQSELYNLRNTRPNAAVKQSRLQTILNKSRGITNND